MAEQAAETANGARPSGESIAARRLARGTVVVVGTAALLLSVLYFLWRISDILLVAFGGVLGGVFLHTVSDFLSRKLKLRYNLALVLFLALGIGAVALISWRIEPEFEDQYQQMTEQIPQSFERIKGKLQESEWGQRILQMSPQPAKLFGEGQFLSRAQGAVATTVGVLATFFIMIIMAVYMAADPRLYRVGALRLAPKPHRERAKELMQTLRFTLFWWSTGRLIGMLLVGILTGVGLWLLGVKLAFSLAVIAALLDFVPNIGPIVAAVPALLIALMDGPEKALWTGLLYVGVQQVEGLILTPNIEKRAVELPPAIVIVAQVVFGLLFGFMGLLLASPLAACVMVLVKMLYVQDTLKDPIEVKGDAASDGSAPEAA